MGGRRNSSCMYPVNEFDLPLAQSHTSPALATYLNIPQQPNYPPPAPPGPHPHPMGPHFGGFAGFDDNFNLRGPPFLIMPPMTNHMGYFYNSSGRGYAQNGVGTFQRNSIHDYQPLAPFQDGNGHMQTIGG